MKRILLLFTLIIALSASGCGPDSSSVVSTKWNLLEWFKNPRNSFNFKGFGDFSCFFMKLKNADLQ